MLSHLSTHRPMFPEYPYREKELKNIQFLSGHNCFTEEGEAFKIEDYAGLRSHIMQYNLLIFVSSLIDPDSFPFLYECIKDSLAKVVCDRDGTALAVRIKGEQNRSYWIVRIANWYIEEEMTAVQFIKGMREFFEYVEEGTSHTPSSFGKHLMRKIYMEHDLKRITGLSLDSEDFIRRRSFGGIVYTPGLGTLHKRACKIDKYNAYLSKWGKKAGIGAAILFSKGRVDLFSIFFAECEITIYDDLALGPFPVREHKRFVWYPTKKGVYTTYLWDNQIKDVLSSGCDVIIKNGIGWVETCDYNEIWAFYMHDLRMNAPNDFIAKNIKLCAVSAMGGHAGGRTHYYLVPEERATEAMRNVPDEDGEPLDIYIAEEYDGSSAILIHHNKRMISAINSDVYNFALPFAKEGKLLMADYDSIMTIEVGDEGEKYIKRRSIEGLQAEPGTWLLEYRHNVHIRAPRAYTCDEEEKLPGIKKNNKKLKIL